MRTALRFSIRDLLWLTLVVALALGWWSDRRIYVNRAEQAQIKVFTLEKDLNNLSIRERFGEVELKMLRALRDGSPLPRAVEAQPDSN